MRDEMQSETTDALSKMELLEQIKHKCKTGLKFDFYSGLIVSALILALMLYVVLSQYPFDASDIVFLAEGVVFFGIGVWILINACRFGKTLDSIDTPERLLGWYKKRLRNGKICALVCTLVVTTAIVFRANVVGHADWPSTITLVVITWAFVIFLFYCVDKSGMARNKDRRILEQLQALAEESG